MNDPTPPTPPAAPLPRVWTTLELINWTKTYFEKKGIDSPRLEAELLLAEVLGCPRIRLYVDFEKPVAPEQLAKFRDFVKRRGDTREPVQYILGQTQFINLKIKVSPSALIPRPETELLAVQAVEWAKTFGAAPRVLDLCTGTGCIALYVASKIPDALVVATDISEKALGLAAENAQALNLSERITFLKGDLFEALNNQAPFDVIISNPPYIDETTRSSLQVEVREHEPALALFAQDGGLEINSRILSGADAWLKPGGCIGLEFGVHQAQRIKACAETARCFEDIQIAFDSAKLPRFLHARKMAV